jgi:hypothetical protein
MRIISNLFALTCALFVPMAISFFKSASSGEYSHGVSNEMYALGVISVIMAFGCLVGYFFYRDCVWFENEEAEVNTNANLDQVEYVVNWYDTGGHEENKIIG